MRFVFGSEVDYVEGLRGAGFGNGPVTSIPLVCEDGEWKLAVVEK